MVREQNSDIHVMVLHQQKAILKATRGLGSTQREVILTALRLSIGNLLVPLRETTARFLSEPRTKVEYNLYLQSISHIPFRTPESTHTVKSILAHIDQSPSPIAISTATYSRLIRPSFTPVPLLVYLHHRLTLLHPSRLPLPLLLSFLKAYSKLSLPSKASLIFSQIHAHPRTTPTTLHHASTLLLSAQPNQQAAYDVLLSSPSSPYHSSASLHVLSKDLSVPPQRLIHSFLQLTSSLHNPPLLPLYTSLINGLILRKRFRTASLFFTKLLKLTKHLDIPSLSAGLNALTRAGNPHHAFQILESFYPPLLPDPCSHLPLITFITALNRISRPDLSTLLFFLYPALYPSSPPHNAHMLNLLLQAARTAIKMDQHLHRAKSLLPQNIKQLLHYLHSKSHRNKTSILSRLNLSTTTLIHNLASSMGKNLGYQHLIAHPLHPFGAQHPNTNLKPHPHPRLEASNLILSHLGHPSRGALRQFSHSSVYKSIPTGTWARVVFLRVLAGLNPHIHNIKPPANSYLPIPSLDPQQPTLDSFSHLFAQSKRRVWVPYTPSHFYNPTLWDHLRLPPTKHTSDRTPFYPSIIPTNSNFFNYLILLGLSHTSPPIKVLSTGQITLGDDHTSDDAPTLPPPCTLEIPLVLAWMRTLSIQPSNSTLAVALVMWGQLCARWDGEGGGDGEYVRLVDYLREWVGEERLPHWRTLEKWRGVVRGMGVGERDDM